MPTLMRVGKWLAVITGGAIWLALGGALAGCGNYAINGQAVSSTEFLSVIGLAFATIGSLLLAIAYGIHYERGWSRHVVIAFWVYQLLLVVVLTGGSQLIAALVAVAPFLGGSAVYLYGADEVNAYFRAVRERDARAAAFERAMRGPRE